MRTTSLLVLVLLPGLALAQATPRTPNLKLKYGSDAAANENFARLDDLLGGFTAWPTRGLHTTRDTVDFTQSVEDGAAPLRLSRKSDTGTALEFYDTTNAGVKAYVDALGQYQLYYAPGIGEPALKLGQRGDVIYSDGVGGQQDTYIGRTGVGVLSVGHWGNGAAPGVRISNDGAASGYGSGQYWDGYLQIDGNNGGSLTQMYLTNTGNEFKWSNDNSTFYGALGYYGMMQYAPTAQTIAAGNTITADACGGIKRIDAAGAVTTDTTNTFTAPAAGNAGCVMTVCNSGANSIALDKNALFVMDTTDEGGDGDLDLGADDCVSVGSDGSKWRQLARMAVN